MTCKSCGKNLPAKLTIKFCPFCGSSREEPATEERKSDTAPYLGAPKDKDIADTIIDDGKDTREEPVAAVTREEPTVMDTIETDQPAIEEPAEEDSSEAATLFEIQAVDVTIQDAAPAAVPAIPSSEQRTVINMDAVSQEEMEALMRRSSEPAMPVSRAPQATRAETPKATKKSKKGGKKDDKKDAKFSETAWFMQAVTPESLAEAEGEALSYAEQDSMTDRYRTEERLPDEVRKDFSLTMNEGEVPDEEALSKPPPNRKKKRKK